jgi:hypothetical protein
VAATDGNIKTDKHVWQGLCGASGIFISYLDNWRILKICTNSFISLSPAAAEGVALGCRPAHEGATPGPDAPTPPYAPESAAAVASAPGVPVCRHAPVVDAPPSSAVESLGRWF